ncbi:DUF4190 domain-containing protein [Nocardia sp. SYP-A9097]|uniref:DUF4190 domain-containing protein n=1 Tax=Nocardia sp. SYP-A9097 TaxID=2663237 RepID=UPI00129ACF69|nr:DUF4190 domain-containing protein [Nocardia sp. SYP-A9097]MRH86064.1 DUF4190 domain-containing protein [Nocardia sp. SYP-A9097]
MTQPGDSDEWWKQYGGDSAPGAAAPQPTPPPAGYSSAPNLQKPPATPGPQPLQYPPVNPPSQPQYPNYPPPQPNPSGGFAQPNSGGFAQPAPGQPYNYQPGYQPYGYQAPGLGTNGLAIASLIVSVLGLSTLFFCFLPIGSLVGLVLGVVALNQVKQSGQDGRGLAQGGIWVGAAGLALGIVLWLILGAAFIGAGSS